MLFRSLPHTAGRLLGVLLLLLFLVPAARAEMTLTKISDEPVIHTAEGFFDGQRITLALTGKKIIAINQLGEVVTEVTGLQQAARIAVAGQQIFVIGSTTNDAPMDLRKYRWSAGKISLVGSPVNKGLVSKENRVELMVFGNEIWVLEARSPSSSFWTLRQYYRGGDNEGMKARPARGKYKSQEGGEYAEHSQLERYIGPGNGASDTGIANNAAFYMAPAPDGGSFYFLCLLSNGNTRCYKLEVTDDEIKKTAEIELINNNKAVRVQALSVNNNGVYALLYEGQNQLSLFKLGHDLKKPDGGLPIARLMRTAPASMASGSLLFTDSSVFVAAAVTGGGGVALENRNRITDRTLAGNVGNNVVVAKISEDLSYWSYASILPAGGSAPVFLDPGSPGGYQDYTAKPFLSPVNGGLQLVGSVISGTASFEANKQISGKAGFVIPLSSVDLGFLQKSVNLAVRAEIKDANSPGGTVALGLPNADVSPALGSISQSEGSRVTVKMPEHAYQFDNGAFLQLQGMSTADLDARIRQENVVARYTPVGYTITREGDAQTVTGSGASVSVVMTKSTTVTFHFKRDYALHISSFVTNIADFDNSKIQGMGNPNPPSQKHWIEENTVVAPQVDGVVTSPVDLGSRFVTTAYWAHGAAGTGGVFQADNPRQQVPQFVMTGTAGIGYQWRRQHSISVYTSTSKSAGLPAIHIGGQVHPGSGTFWFDANQPWKIAASDDPSLGESMRGVLNASGMLQELNGYTRSKFPAADNFSYNGRTYAGKFYGTLTGPSSITWDYGTTIYRQVVSIGSAVQLSGSGGEAFSAAERLTPAVTARIDPAKVPKVISVLDAPPGSEPSGMMVWSPAGRKAWPVRPGRFLIEWPVNDGGVPVLTEITSGFAGDTVRHPSFTSSPRLILPSEIASLIPLRRTAAGQANNVANSGDYFLHFVNLAMDGNPATKYLIQEGAHSGLVIIPRQPLMATAMELMTGDDLPKRDPLTYTLEASNDADSGPWTLLSSGQTGLSSDPGRNATGSRVGFPNDRTWKYYRLLFPSLRTTGSEMQVAEVRLIGVPSSDAPRFPGEERNYRAVLHEGMPAIDLDRSSTDDTTFRQLAFSCGLTPAGGTDIPSSEMSAPVVAPVMTGQKLLSFPVTGGNLRQAEGKHVLVLTKSAAGTPSKGDENREEMMVRVLETRRWDSDREWGKTTRVSVRKFQNYSFVPSQTNVKTAPSTVIREFTLLEGGQERRPVKVEAYHAHRANPQTDGNPNRLFDRNGEDLTYTDSTKNSPVTFYFDRPMSIDGFRFQAGSEPGQLDNLPGKFSLFGNTDANNWINIANYEAESYPVASLDSSGTTPVLALNEAVYELGAGPMIATGGNVTIGSRITDTFYDRAGLGTGFVTGVKARYNVNVYNRSLVSDAGPVIPVNRQFTGQPEDELTVIWYESSDNILWPWRPVRYTAQWPQNPPRIVIASRLGSDGLSASGTPQFKFSPQSVGDVKIYNQPDPELPGFNPNEEHALVSGSLQYASDSTPPRAAYALRDDLNVGVLPENADADPSNNPAHPDYTSDPFVLVQYTDSASGEPRMAVYRVEKEDTAIGKLDSSAAGLLSPMTVSLKPGAVRNEQETHMISLTGITLQEQEAVEVRFAGSLGGVSSGGTYYVRRLGGDRYALTETPGGLPLGRETQVQLASDLRITRLHPYIFHYPATAGQLIPAPNPLDLVVGLSPSPETYGGSTASFTDVLNPVPRVYYEDHTGTPWAVSEGECFTRFFYRMRGDFWYKRKTDGAIAGAREAGTQVTAGTSIAFAPEDAAAKVPRKVVYTARWPETAPVLKVGESLAFAGGEYKQDHPDAEGLPGVLGWASGRVVFDSLNPSMDAEPAATATPVDLQQARARTFTSYSARLIPPLGTRSVSLESLGITGTELQKFRDAIAPATGITEVKGTQWQFTNLPASLKTRVFFDSSGNRLGIRGFVNEKTLGDTTLTASPPPAWLLEPNILSPRDRSMLLEFKANAAEDADLRAIIGGDKWLRAVDALYALSRNPDSIRKTPGSNDDASHYYAGMGWAPQRDERGNILRFGLNGAVPAGADKTKIPATAPRVEGRAVPTFERGAPPSLLGPGLALTPSPFLLDPNPADKTLKAILDRQFKNPDDSLYLTLAENDDPAIGGPVSLHVVKIVKKHRYRGALKLVEGTNAFSEKVTLRHTGDFGGNAEDIVYEWYYRPEDGRAEPWPYKDGTSVLPWQVFADDSGGSIAGLGMNQIDVAGKGKFILPDLWFITRYRHRNDTPSSASWAGTQHVTLGKPDPESKKGELWAGAANSPQPNGDYVGQLVPGWLKRVLDRINPYEARFTDFRQDAPATYISMVQQAGPRYTGPVALNPDKNVIENTGLIELYQTLLERGSKFAFAETITDPALRSGVMNALQLASTRIQDLYMVLGNEAYADSLDPLVGFGSGSAQYGSAASSIWTFMNQTASPLDEELALLRGGSFDFGRPVHNRLFWNFTKDLGEVAYAQNYNLSDENGDGFINEADAMLRYPQGHGDAWGHYTTAVKMHYSLLHNQKFIWQPRSEFYNLMDVVVPVDFYDERKFAFAAAARAKAGADVVGLTYRQRYTEDPGGQWQGYTDTDTDRTWGVQEWARRAGEASLLDWAAANSLLPAAAENRGAVMGIGSVSELNGGQSYRVTLRPTVTLPKEDAVRNAIRYLLTVTPPGEAAREIIFQPEGPSQSTTLSIAPVAAGAGEFSVSLTAGSPVAGLTKENFSLAVFDRPEGIQRVDRGTVTSISQIASEYARIETTMRNADTGLNPLGLSNDAVPFDIDPSAFAGRDGREIVSHFQQIYERARKAADNAHTIFDSATEQLNQVRRQQDSLDAFSDEVAKGDAELRNRLIEIFGSPHAGNIGAGKPYPAGYAGPDLFFHMYVDVKDVSAETVPFPPADSDSFKILWAGFEQQLLRIDPGFFPDPPAGATAQTTFKTVTQRLFLNDMFPDEDPLSSTRDVSIVDSGVLELNLPVRANGYAFQAPSSWGARASTGELQSLISDLVRAEAGLALAIDGYNATLGEIKDAVAMLSAQYGVALEEIKVLQEGRDEFISLARKIANMDSISASLNFAADRADDIYDAVSGDTPDTVIAGTAVGGNAPKAAKIPGVVVERGITTILRTAALGLEIGAIQLGPNLETENFDVAIAQSQLAAKFEVQQRLIELKTLLGGEGPARLAVFQSLEALRQISDAYRTKLQQGLTLLDERQAFNRNAAGAVQEYRYQDMTFRVFRNEALEKYRAAFDLAARYAWLAAKAYDYETNLSASDPASAQGVLEDIIKARTIGGMVNGEPVNGGGLAGALAALRDNYGVVSGQMGLNNAQSEDSKISLRAELFRISKTAATDSAWRAELAKYRESDLWQVPEFRRYCRPFAPSGSAQPGLVIPIGTQILAGKNLFGKPLGPGDHAFDPTLFATKVNAVGVWFENYDMTKLPVAPRVYLVPAGLDIMTIPNSPDLETRSWNIVDQRIPAPHALGGSPLGVENWRPVRDTLDGPIGEIRKFSSFRAYGSSAAAGSTADAGEMTYDSRLTGRSVWNTKWLLIIPGLTFNASAGTGLDTFTGTGGITDISLVIKTSGFSGN